eukprot:12892398-Prorocentrum_lima.AAC.1
MEAVSAAFVGHLYSTRSSHETCVWRLPTVRWDTKLDTTYKACAWRRRCSSNPWRKRLEQRCTLTLPELTENGRE